MGPSYSCTLYMTICITVGRRKQGKSVFATNHWIVSDLLVRCELFTGFLGITVSGVRILATDSLPLWLNMHSLLTILALWVVTR